MDIVSQRLIRRLTKVLPLWPDELLCDTPDDRQRLLSRVFFAIIEERERGRNTSERGQHWAYSLPRHAELFCIYEDMRAHFLALDRETSAADVGMSRETSA